MIESIVFRNYKVLRKARLPLGPLTLLVGANGSGKSTALGSIDAVLRAKAYPIGTVRSVAARESEAEVAVSLHWPGGGVARSTWRGSRSRVGMGPSYENDTSGISKLLPRVRVFRLRADAIAAPTPLQPRHELGPHGEGLVGVLDRLRDEAPERFEALNTELRAWLPEYDKVLFETPAKGTRAVVLRQCAGGHKIRAGDLSDGTLLALALLTMAYLPEPPPLVGLEEPDHGIHPRLLRRVRDALYRLAYPADFGEKREAVQVLATTHSPYFLDLFRDHPEEVVIASKQEDGAVFERLIDREDIAEILSESPLGEVWYSGILGGVPVGK